MITYGNSHSVFCLSLLLPLGTNGSNGLLFHWGPSKASWLVPEIFYQDGDEEEHKNDDHLHHHQQYHKT